MLTKEERKKMRKIVDKVNKRISAIAVVIFILLAVGSILCVEYIGVSAIIFAIVILLTLVIIDQSKSIERYENMLTLDMIYRKQSKNKSTER